MTSPTKKSIGTLAVQGIAWTGFTVVITKIMSIVSQVALGYLLSVEAYAVFAAASATLVFVSGFQNSGVAKVLIQQQSKYDNISADYGGFSFYIGITGAIILILISFPMSDLYRMPTLNYVLIISALSIPILSINTLYTAKLSIGLRFKAASGFSVAYSAIYYAILIPLAALGAQEFSIALATLIGTLGLFALYRHRIGSVEMNFMPNRDSIFHMVRTLKWTILSSYLFGLSQSGDYIVLGRMLSQVDLGQYFFGYMITSNIGLLLSLAISQALMPIFSRIQGDAALLKSSFLNASHSINFLAGLICIVIVGSIPETMHLIWREKWDPAAFVAVVMAVTFPIRIHASFGAVALESKARWRLRTILLAYDGFGLMAFALIGCHFWGMNGAAICVAIHRGVTGLLSYPAGMKAIGFGYLAIFRDMLLGVAPFVVVAGVLLLAKPHVMPTISEPWTDMAYALGMTGVALVVFTLLTAAVRPDEAGRLIGKVRRFLR